MTFSVLPFLSLVSNSQTSFISTILSQTTYIHRYACRKAEKFPREQKILIHMQCSVCNDLVSIFFGGEWIHVIGYIVLSWCPLHSDHQCVKYKPYHFFPVCRMSKDINQWGASLISLTFDMNEKNTKKIKLRRNKKSPAWKYQPGQLEGGKRLMSHEQKRRKKKTQAIKVQLAPSVSYTEIRHRFIHKILHTW